MASWYSFTTRKGKVSKIVPSSPHVVAKYLYSIDVGLPGNSHFVAARDELHAWIIINKWLELGKPLTTSRDIQGSKGMWKYDDLSKLSHGEQS